VALRHTEDVDHLVGGEHAADMNLLLEPAGCEIDAFGHRATVHLDFHQMGFLLTQIHFFDLKTSKNIKKQNLKMPARQLKFRTHTHKRQGEREHEETKEWG